MQIYCYLFIRHEYLYRISLIYCISRLEYKLKCREENVLLVFIINSHTLDHNVLYT